MSETGGAHAGRASFAFIFLTVTLDMLAVGLMVPVLPRLLLELEGGNTARAAAITGVFGFVWALMQFVFSPVLGALSDRFGRRPIVLLSNLGLGLDYVLMALAPTVVWLFVGRVISGITSASFATAGAYVSDISPKEKRAARFGMLGAAFGLGFILGPAVGGALGALNLRLPFWAAAALSLLNAAYGFFILPESLPKARRAAFSWARAHPLGALRLLRSHPELFGLGLGAFLSFLAHEALPSTFVLYAHHRYGWDERTVGFTLAGIGVCTTLVSGGLVGAVTRKLGERRAAVVGLVCGAAGYAVYGLAPKGSWFLAGLPLVALWGLAGPSLQALMTRQVDGSEQGRLQGALGSLRGITGMVGPLLFTQSFALALSPGSFLPWSGVSFLLGAALLLVSMGVAWGASRTPAPVRLTGSS